MSQIIEVQQALIRRQKELERAIDIAQKQLGALPEAKLRISHNRGTSQFYEITDKKDTIGKYIKKKEMKRIEDLAQRGYTEKFLKAATEEAEIIEDMIAKMKSISDSMSEDYRKLAYHSDQLYSKMSKERQNLVTPILITDEEYAIIWEKTKSNYNEYRAEEKIYPTKRGDMVRSKSEVMIANMYYELGIPYRYEAELKLKSGRTVYPDFTLLDTNARKEIYHEHMGLLDDDEYRSHNLRKIEEYRKNGIFMGKNLIITHESAGSPLNIRNVEMSTRWIFRV